MQNLSYEDEFDLRGNKHVSGTYFLMNGFALRLVLTQIQLRNGRLTLLCFVAVVFVVVVVVVVVVAVVVVVVAL